MNAPKHTIIVPAYNTGDAIRKCIKSVMCQTFQDFELIIVDDGSKDQTPLIIDEYAANDYRIKAIHIPMVEYHMLAILGWMQLKETM